MKLTDDYSPKIHNSFDFGLSTTVGNVFIFGIWSPWTELIRMQDSKSECCKFEYHSWQKY